MTQPRHTPRAARRQHGDKTMITIRCKDPVVQGFLMAAAVAFALVANVVSTVPDNGAVASVVQSDEKAKPT